MRIGKVSVNKRKIKQIRSQGNNVIVDASGPQQGFFPGNMFAIDYRDVTAPQTFATVEELEAWVIQGSLLNYNPTTDADLNLLASGRSGLTIPATVGTTPTILPTVALLNPSGSAYIGLATPISLTKGEIIIHALVPTPIAGTAGLIYGSSGGTRINIATATTITFVATNSLTFNIENLSLTAINIIRFVITTDTVTRVRCYCNDVESTSGQLSMFGVNTININILGYNTGPTYLSYIKVTSDVTNILEMHTLGIGVGREFDESGSNNQGNWQGYTPHNAFRSDGSSYMLDSGYYIYKLNGAADVIVPMNGYAGGLVSLGYSLSETIIGKSDKHNLASSMLQFTEAVWDRSNATIWSDLARAGYYNSTDANTKKQWHSSELHQDNISYWLNPDYKDVCFAKFEDNTIEFGRNLSQIFSCNSPKTGSNLTRVLSYTGYIYNRFDNGKMIMGLDGATVVVYNGCKALLDLGIIPTLYLIPDEVDTLPGIYMTWANVAELMGLGVDIQDHPVDFNTGLTVAQVQSVYDSINSQFADHGIPTPEHTAYLGGQSDANVLTAVPTRRLTGRGAAAHVGSFVYRKGYKFLLPGVNIGQEVVATLKTKMTLAVANRSCIVSYFHGKDAPNADNGLTQAEIEEIITHGVSVGIDFITHKQYSDLAVH